MFASPGRIRALGRAHDDQQVEVGSGEVPDGADEDAAAEPGRLAYLLLELLIEDVEQRITVVRKGHVVESCQSLDDGERLLVGVALDVATCLDLWVIERVRASAPGRGGLCAAEVVIECLAKQRGGVVPRLARRRSRRRVGRNR